jgi:hypothetical protein
MARPISSPTCASGTCPACYAEHQAPPLRHRRRTTRHPGYVVGMHIRKWIEEVFAWMKTAGGLRKTRYRGTAKLGWMFTLSAVACNRIRLPELSDTAT